MFYDYSNSFDLVGYSSSDWAGVMGDRKNTTSLVFYMGDTTLTWSSKKQSTVILSICETEYVATTTCVYHSIWIRRLLKELRMPREKPTKIYVDNSSAITLAKNQVFHVRSKHIDRRFYYLRDCITNKEIEVKYVKTQN